MKAMTIARPGGPESLVLTEVPTPEPAPGEVRIRVIAAGINGADLSQRRGHYPPPHGAPKWPGLEVSGTVDAVGEGVTAWQPGDAVCALLSGGGYAEAVTVDAGLVFPIPAGTDPVEAAALPEVTSTVWSNVFDLGQLKSGETLLVHGGSSGIGSMAIQLAGALSSRVIATAGSPEKTAYCRQLGADVAVDYHNEDFVSAAVAFTDGRGVDVVLDIVGGDYIARDLEALAVNGRIMSIAVRDRSPAAVDIGLLMRKRARLWGTTLRARPLDERIAIVSAVRQNVWPLIASGRVQPVIDSVFPLADAAQAHQRMESSAHLGKIVLRVG